MVLEIKVPNIGESITEVTLASWLIEEGEYVEMDQAICELESDKATLELPAEKAGIVKFVASVDDDLAIGDMVCTIDTSAKAPTKVAPAKEEAVVAEPKKEAAQEKHSSPTPVATSAETESITPVAAAMLKEHGLSASSISGTGPNGRIVKEDVARALSSKNGNGSSNGSAKTPAAPAPVLGGRGVRREKMSRLRRTIAAHLVNAKNNTAMLTTFNEVDLTEIKAIRAKYKESFKEKHQIGLGFMGFFTKACTIALQEFPNVNAQLDGEELIFHDFVDISMAISTPKGLVTPVLRNVETMDLSQIEKGIKALALKGREGKIQLADLEGGTFTISNGGVFGSLQSTPIINAPQTAILGMHAIKDRPVAINGEVVIRPMMYLALSYDHRVIDGKGAVSFLVKVKELLEDPIRLILDL